LDKLLWSGKLIAPDEVLFELEKKEGDGLFAWAKEREEVLFHPLDQPLQGALRAVLASHARLLGELKGRNQADPFVVALAKLRGLRVVTQEAMGNGTTRIRIPDVCKALEIPCIDLVELIKECNWKF
jgi:hypothetical protein